MNKFAIDSVTEIPTAIQDQFQNIVEEYVLRNVKVIFLRKE